MEIKDVGVIIDIDPDKFIADGSIYIEKDYLEEENERVTVKNKLIGLSFESKINKILNDISNQSKSKDPELRGAEIEKFFSERRNSRIDVIFFPETGIRGTDKFKHVESSILYMSLSGNVKLGFIIDKTFAKIVFGGEKIGDTE